MPYNDTLSLTLYAVVVLHTRCGVRLVYRATDMYGFLLGYDNPYFSFDSCIANLLHDVCGEMSNTSVLPMQDAA